MLIDGQVAYTGGINLADEYINKIERFGHWKDTALMLEGPAVDTFLVLLLQMWTYSHELLDVTSYMVLSYLTGTIHLIRIRSVKMSILIFLTMLVILFIS